MLKLDPGRDITDLRLFLIAAAAFVLVAAWLAIVSARHRSAVASIPCRVHVAGTRGKSTTTRLVAAGLRASGLRVVAKTTGSAARLILPDGTEQPWPRRGPASIIEQLRFIRLAAQLGADAIVVECMAIRPDLVAASEGYLLRATAAVIVNARPDHAEDLGSDADAMALALAEMAPSRGLLVLSEEAAVQPILARAAQRHNDTCTVAVAGLDGLAADTALAMALCGKLGVDPMVAAKAMAAVTPDPGFLSVFTASGADRPARFINAFACNDVASLADLWSRHPQRDDTVVLFNARPDRPLRSRDFLTWLARLDRRPRLLVGGDRLAMRLAGRMGWAKGDVHWIGNDIAAAMAQAARLTGNTGTVWGLGNWKGLGERATAYLDDESRPC